MKLWKQGPDFLNGLFSCMLACREKEIAVVGDICKMFKQIQIGEKDRRFHRFLW